jgi:lycopene cyclase domain-containing protein
MKWEYLIFNAVIIAGPLLYSFDDEIRYVDHWKSAAAGIVAGLVPFIIWDALVTGRHWWFNKSFTSGITIAGLPLGEWLFFITVPFACIFVWEIITYRKELNQIDSLKLIYYVLFAGIGIGIWAFASGLEYTGLVLIALGAVAMLDMFTNSYVLLQSRTYLFLAIVIGLVLVFNGYLTARPVVLYGEQYQLSFRIITIPIEDFFYGFSLLLLNVIVYEKFRRRVYA